MNDDLIKRSDAIGAITNHCENECYYRVDNWCPQCQREEFEEAIKAVPSADRPQEWIPCSERLPKKYGQQVLCCNKDGRVFSSALTYMHPEYKYWYFGKHRSVIAWMPLPEPYREDK